MSSSTSRRWASVAWMKVFPSKRLRHSVSSQARPPRTTMRLFSLVSSSWSTKSMYSGALASVALPDLSSRGVVIRGTPRHRENRPRRILVRLRHKRPAVGAEEVLHVVRLAVAVEHRLRFVRAHADTTELVDDRAAGGQSVPGRRRHLSV